MPDTVSEESQPKSPAKAAKHTAKSRRGKRRAAGAAKTQTLAFPKHTISECLRIPRAILEQNAGKECTDREAAKFAGIGYTGDVAVEISSGIKYGLLERPAPGTVRPTDVTRRIVRPQKPNDRTDAMREAVLHAPVISDLYKHYRGENLPDKQFLVNTARDTYHVPEDKVDLFVDVFQATLQESGLLEEISGKKRVVDVTHTPDVEGSSTIPAEQLKKVSKGVTVQAGDTCFVMMPFALPLGGYYTTVYEPAIKKAGITPVRADADIFGTGKIIDQIWSGINAARVLVAELTGRNPNVLYELGLAHALKKPVVLVSSNEGDVPFDVRHVRVIYYDVMDPFWGEKLISKVAENIVSALKNPKEAILFEAPKAS
jgi:hypothetical protein